MEGGKEVRRVTVRAGVRLDVGEQGSEVEALLPFWKKKKHRGADASFLSQGGES